MSEIRRFNKWLPVQLTEHETLERARSLSQRHKEKEEVEAEKARVTRDFGEKLKKLSGEISRLSSIVASGEEDRNVECEEQKMYSEKKIRTIRLDTGDIVDIRPMMESELQLEVF